MILIVAGLGMMFIGIFTNEKSFLAVGFALLVIAIHEEYRAAR